MVICEFTSPLELLNQATHYRMSQKDGQGPVSEIVKRDRCKACDGVIWIEAANGVNATFASRHLTCVTDQLRFTTGEQLIRRYIQEYNKEDE